MSSDAFMRKGVESRIKVTGAREGVGYGRVWVWYGGASGCGGGVDGGGTRGVVGT